MSMVGSCGMMGASTSFAPATLGASRAGALRRGASPRVGLARGARPASSRAAAGRVAATAKVTLVEPKVVPVVKDATVGFTFLAERLNSRAAMIGFFALLAVEGISGKAILELIGLDIGGGLNIPL